MICWAEERRCMDGMCEQRRGKQSCHSLNHHHLRYHRSPLACSSKVGTQVVPPKKDLGLPKTMATNAVFVYTGAGGESAPDDVIRALVDPSVTTIPEDAFYKRKKLAEVELCEGLVEVRDFAFDDCGHSITKINIPNSLRRIGYAAFVSSLRTPIRLHDGIESIGESAFASCIFTNFRVPSLITVIFPGLC